MHSKEISNPTGKSVGLLEAGWATPICVDIAPWEERATPTCVDNAPLEDRAGPIRMWGWMIDAIGLKPYKYDIGGNSWKLVDF